MAINVRIVLFVFGVVRQSFEELVISVIFFRRIVHHFQLDPSASLTLQLINVLHGFVFLIFVALASDKLDNARAGIQDVDIGVVYIFLRHPDFLDRHFFSVTMEMEQAGLVFPGLHTPEPTFDTTAQISEKGNLENMSLADSYVN